MILVDLHQCTWHTALLMCSTFTTSAIKVGKVIVMVIGHVDMLAFSTLIICIVILKIHDPCRYSC